MKGGLILAFFIANIPIAFGIILTLHTRARLGYLARPEGEKQCHKH